MANRTRQFWGIWKLRPAYSPETPNLGQNRWCFVPCDLEIWWMTLENNRESLLCCFKLCATFHSHRSIQTGATVRKRPIWVKFDHLIEPCDLEIWQMTMKNNMAPLYATSSFVHHFVAIGELKQELQSGNAQFGQIRRFFELCDLEIGWMTLKNNRAPLLCNIKLCASFHHHMWIQTGVTVRKRFSWVLTYVTLTVDFWPWPFAWILLWSLVITPENFMMIRWG